MILIDWFYPNYFAGGPVTAVYNFINYFNDVFDIFIVTGDTDLGQSKPNPNIHTDEWVLFSLNCYVYYFSSEKKKITLLCNLIQAIKPDILFLNGIYSYFFVMIPLILKNLGMITPYIYLAPRGMLKNSALLIKPKKKWFYLNFIESLNLFRHVTLLYTDKSEINEKYFTHSHSHIISDPFPSQLQQVEKKKLLKSKGMLKLIFLSRIHPIKNLHYVIERLFSFKEKLIELTVVGHIDDEPYWIKCKDMIKLLPNSIVVNYLGVINPTNVYDVLQSNHVFILPTLGENFGYAIFETFLAGRPVIISDQTPWQKLQERQVGWSIPIIDTEAWERAIANCIELNQTDFDEYCQNSWHFSRKYIEKSSLKKDYIHIFTND